MALLGSLGSPRETGAELGPGVKLGKLQRSWGMLLSGVQLCFPWSLEA